MFEIIEEPFGKFKQYVLKNTSTGEFVAVIPEFGATINQLVLQKNNSLHELIDGCSTYEELITEGKDKFKGSVLFPFPNRIKDGTYTFNEKNYQLPINFPNENNAIHGFVYDVIFNVLKEETSTNSAFLSVEYSTFGNEKGHPFKATIKIDFILNKEGFSCTTHIQNNDKQPIPFGTGWHPYFKTGSKIDECYLSLPVSHSFEVDERMIPTGKIILEKKFNVLTKIENTNFDTGYKIAKPTIVTTIIEDKIKKIKLIILQNANGNQYNYLQVYIPAHRNSIAIEPMTCLTNAFNNKEGLIVLEPGEIKVISFGVKLE